MTFMGKKMWIACVGSILESHAIVEKDPHMLIEVLFTTPVDQHFDWQWHLILMMKVEGISRGNKKAKHCPEDFQFKTNHLVLAKQTIDAVMGW